MNSMLEENSFLKFVYTTQDPKNVKLQWMFIHCDTHLEG